MRRLSQASAVQLAKAWAPDSWWRWSMVAASGVTFDAAFTRQQVWMASESLERRYVATERAIAMPMSEPLAPTEYKEAVVEWCAGLGDIVECPTCAGNGRTTCKTCKGQQRIACPRCGALLDHRPRCQPCNGSGRLQEAACPTCAGRGYEAPCTKCEGSHVVGCPACVGLGQTTCQMCEGNSRVYKVDVASKTYKTTNSLTWHDTPNLPKGMVEILERLLPFAREEPVDKPEDNPDVLLMRRLHYAGPVEVVRFKRLMTTTLISTSKGWEKLPGWLGNALPAEWFMA